MAEMLFERSKTVIAFDARFVTGAVASWSIRGPRLRVLERVAVRSGALVPSPTEANIVDPTALGEALKTLGRSLTGTPRRAILVLPEGIARILLLEAEGRLDIRELGRFRMAAALPYPANEAILDTMPLEGRRHLCGAVRRSVVEGYEIAMARAGFAVVDRVELAPFLAVGGLRRLVSPKDDGVALLLGDAAVSFVAFRRGRLEAFRTRLRAGARDELDWLRAEVSRTAALLELRGPVTTVVLGSGAAAVVDSLQTAGCTARLAAGGPGAPASGGELAWLGSALA